MVWARREWMGNVWLEGCLWRILVEGGYMVGRTRLDE